MAKTKTMITAVEGERSGAENQTHSTPQVSQQKKMNLTRKIEEKDQKLKLSYKYQQALEDRGLFMRYRKTLYTYTLAGGIRSFGSLQIEGKYSFHSKFKC